MATPKVYAFCDANCRWETLTKEQILSAIMQAVNDGNITNIDAGFITTIKTINNESIRFFYGTQAQYDALPDEDKQNLNKVITDDTFRDGVNEAISALQSDVNGLTKAIAIDEENARQVEGRVETLETDVGVLFGGEAFRLTSSSVALAEGIYLVWCQNADETSTTASTGTGIICCKNGVSTRVHLSPYDGLIIRTDRTCQALYCDDGDGLYLESDLATYDGRIFVKKIANI